MGWRRRWSTRPGNRFFSFDLDRNILVRQSHSEYPATPDNPGTIHDDLMIVYPDYTGEPDLS